ncbi:MAG: tetratricopeptide repeat protein [Methyloligellaceae bacterium]
MHNILRTITFLTVVGMFSILTPAIHNPPAALASTTIDLNELLTDGEKKLRKGSLDEAEKAFQNTLDNADPGEDDQHIFRAYLRLGDVWVRKGNLSKSQSKSALDQYEQAFLFYRRGIVFNSHRLKTANQGTAKERAKELVSLFQRAGNTLVNMDKTQAALKHYNSAAIMLKKLIAGSKEAQALRQQLASLFSTMGDQFKKLGQKKRALKYYQAAVKVMKP